MGLFPIPDPRPLIPCCVVTNHLPLALGDTQEGIHNGGIKEDAALLDEGFGGFLVGTRRLVWSLARDGVEGIGYCKDACFERYLFSLQAERIAASVPPLVMEAHYQQSLLEELHILEHPV